MHDYAGNPASFPTAISLPDDGVDNPDFTVLNTPPEGLADRTAYLKYSFAASVAMGNWHAPVSTITIPGPTTASLGAAAWDPELQHWIALFQHASAAYAFATHGASLGWTNVNVAASAPESSVLAAAASGNGEAVFTCQNLSTGTDIVLVTLAGSIINTAQSFVTGAMTQSVITWVPFAAAYQWIGCTQTGGAFTGYLAGSAAGTGVWTNGTSTLPSSWRSGTNHIGGFVSAINPLSSGSTMAVLVGMCAKTVGTDTSRLLGLCGAGYSDITPSLLSGKQLTGLAWNPVVSLWGLLCCDNANGYFYTSPDASTWTLAHTFVGCVSTGGLACIDAIWAVQLTVAGGSFYSGTALNDRIMLSNNNGTSWTTAGYQMGGDSTGGVWNFPQLRASGNQLLAYNNLNHSFSNQAGFTPQGAF